MEGFGLWFEQLLKRCREYRRLINTRPDTFWLGGMLNPTAFLTSVKQEICRKHKSDLWQI